MLDELPPPYREALRLVEPTPNDSGERAAALLPLESDAVSGPFVLAYLARVYTTAGRYDRATAVLERLMRTDSWITPAALRADPIWDPLRRYAPFRRLAGEETPVTSSRALSCHPERSEGSCWGLARSVAMLGMTGERSG